MQTTVKELFMKIFQTIPKKYYFSPGRVNIIGGHTDYNGGAVLPFCIHFGIYGAIRFRKDRLIRVYSDNIRQKGIVTFDLDHLDYDNKRDYANYVSGVLLELAKRDYHIIHGFDLLLSGNLPRGGGLSSSAALLILITKILNDQCHFGLDGTQMALLSKAVENYYIGVSCGIMDQFVIANGKDNHAIYLESNTLHYEYIPCNMDQYKFVLINSNTTRKLSESKYNTRQQETQEVLKILQEHVNIQYICDLLPQDYNLYEGYIENMELKKRFKHLLYEHDRVKKAKVALTNQDFVTLGKLLLQAHESARDLYCVSSDILDRLVELAMNAGSMGSKMIGGGFGGSTLNLIQTEKLTEFMEAFTDLYVQEFQVKPIMNIVEVTDGVRELS